MALLFELSEEEDLYHWLNTKNCVAPLGLKVISFDQYVQKGKKTKLGFVEVKMGTSHGHPKFSPNNIQSQRKSMSWDTILQSQFMWWYTLNYGNWRSLRNSKGQMVDNLSKIKLAKNIIFQW